MLVFQDSIGYLFFFFFLSIFFFILFNSFNFHEKIFVNAGRFSRFDLLSFSLYQFFFSLFLYINIIFLFIQLFVKIC